MRNSLIVALVSVCGLTLVVAAGASEHLPAGPIHDRHELMEGIGADAKAIGGAAKIGDKAAAVAAATRMQSAAKKIPALFPKGSLHENSRAKPEIWENWDRFVELAKDLENAAGGVLKVAAEGGELGATLRPVFATCKGCHEAFRVPEEE